MQLKDEIKEHRLAGLRGWRRLGQR